ncbi:hypothetical protein CsSME_00021275 [Camellia sinensis var. sinensis]
MLKEGCVITSPLKSLVEDFKFLIQRCGYAVQHVLREGNKSADGFAKMSANQHEPVVVMDDDPEEICNQVVADMVGQNYLRLGCKWNGFRPDVSKSEYDPIKINPNPI